MEDSCVFSVLGPHAERQSWLFSPSMVCFWRWLYHMVLVESLVVASLIDFDRRIIPDGATLPAMAVGLLGSLVGLRLHHPGLVSGRGDGAHAGRRHRQPIRSVALRPAGAALDRSHPHWHGLAVSLAGLVVGGGSVWIVRIMGQWVLKREAMGFGDVILMATIGSFLGWQPTLDRLLPGAPFCALVVVAAFWIFRRDREIPYGPYLSLATLVVILGWKHIWPADRAILFARPVRAGDGRCDVRCCCS